MLPSVGRPECGDDIVQEIISYAHSQNVTKIAIGKTAESGWKRLRRKDVVNGAGEASPR